MTKSKKQSRLITAADFMAELEIDSQYQARSAAAGAECDARARELDLAAMPIVADLRAAGFAVNSVWDLVNTSEPYPAALPVLLDHLTRGGYPDRVMESLGRALAVVPAASMWTALRALYLAAKGHGEQEGIAVALAASATPEHLDSLISLLDEDSRGDTRIHFLRAIRKVGGNRGEIVVEKLRSDPLFGPEATALAKKKQPSQLACPRITSPICLEDYEN
jgi:hypothetical protein